MNRQVETCLVFPRLICKSQWGWECPRLAGILLNSFLKHRIIGEGELSVEAENKAIESFHIYFRAFSYSFNSDLYILEFKRYLVFYHLEQNDFIVASILVTPAKRY